MSSDTINSFIESTAVIVVFAYLLKRGPMITMLMDAKREWRSSVMLGILFGAVGLVELFFFKNRFPYDTYTLIVTFAALRGGRIVGLITAALVALGAAVFLQDQASGRTVASIFLSLLIGLTVRHFTSRTDRRDWWQQERGAPAILPAVAAIALAETGAIVLRLSEPDPVPFSLPLAALKIGANSLGVMLLQMIVNDAITRRTAEQFRLEAERSRTILAEAQLGALRARIHPHFLFNALTSIAALCRIAPEKAEAATVQLGQIMRRALESDAKRTQSLADEIEYVNDYVEIEKLRLGSRLNVVWNIEEGLENIHIPPFVLQTLVENAIIHGIAPKLEAGTVWIIARARRKHVLIAIRDDGVGMTMARRSPSGGNRPDRRESDMNRDTRPHGLDMATEQLHLLYGPKARLRIFSRPDVGTMVVFRVPRPPALPEEDWEYFKKARVRPAKDNGVLVGTMARSVPSGTER
jgi:LytS/YehU family sensor histidine kinase